MFRLFHLMPLCVIATLVVFSCTEEEQEQIVEPLTPAEADVAAVRAILSANGYDAVEVNTVGQYDTLEGEQRIIVLSLIDSHGVYDIDTIPPDIGALTELTFLNIPGNAVSDLPANIAELTKLRIINATSNNLTSLPAGVWQLDSLRRLDLDSNQIDVLPEEVGQLEKLGTLRIAYNQLTTLPSSMTTLDSLTFFDFEGNMVCSLPPEVETWLMAAPHNMGSDWATTTKQQGCE